jgi:uncharacterized protein (TIGR00375 family)
MNLEKLDEWAKIKGIKILGTGDFTHPEWLTELKEKLKEREPGLFMLKRENSQTRFILTTEVSCIYPKKGKLRKIHIVLFSPSFEIVEKINKRLSLFGNLTVDGRPTLNLDAKELVKIILDISEECLIVPAHLMTPWFSLFGSRSGFNSLEECFEEYSEYIFAGETGLSADPLMLWRMPAGRKLTLISNSDSHSPAKIGREANVFDTDLDYYSILKAIKNKDKNKLLFTIEFFPEEGKYHFDGHRNCGIKLHPKETKKYNGICPICGRPLTIGVLNRVEQLADEPEGFTPEDAIPFKSLVPLKEIIADAFGVDSETVKVQREYESLIKKFENEFNILLKAKREELEKTTTPEVVEGILRMREGKVFKEAGYDGVYGKIRIFHPKEEKTISQQGTLF